MLSLLAGTIPSSGSVDGIASAARFALPRGVARDASGNVYVTDAGNHNVRRISAQGEVTTVAGRAGVHGYRDGPASSALFTQPEGLALHADGSLYVADMGNGAIRRIAVDGTVTTFASSLVAPRALAFDAQGNLVATEENTVVRFSPGGAKTVIAGKLFNEGATDGPLDVARFYLPSGLVLDDAGNIFVASLADTVRRIGVDGMVTTLAGAHRQPGFADGEGTTARFQELIGITRDRAGNLYVTANQAVRRIDPAGRVTTLAGLPNTAGAADGQGAAARFFRPAATVFDGADALYVADYLNNAVRRVTLGGAVTTHAGALPVETRQFATHVAAAADGSLLVAGNNVVSRISPDGEVTALAGASGVRAHMDGPGNVARFQGIGGIAVDAAGIAYVSDTRCDQGRPVDFFPPCLATIRRITPTGEVSTLAGSADVYGSIVDGAGTAARFRRPTGLVADAAGNIYVIDANTVRKIDAARQVSTLAGNPADPDTPGSADGIGAAARFGSPTDIGVDAQGSLYVADAGNRTIRKITPGSVVTTIAGTPGAPAEVRDGSGADARFGTMPGIAVDADGDVYVADVDTVRKVTPEGLVTTVVGQPFVAGFRPGALPGVLLYPSDVAVRGTDLYIAMGTAVAAVRNRP